jgi:hypothetical protein
LLGYTKWGNFEKVIQKAKDACTNAGEDINNHFPGVRKVIEAGKYLNGQNPLKKNTRTTTVTPLEACCCKEA